MANQIGMLGREIDKYIEDLPKHKDLANIIATYVVENDWQYTLGQIGGIIDSFYNDSFGLGIAEEIECLF